MSSAYIHTTNVEWDHYKGLSFICCSLNIPLSTAQGCTRVRDKKGTNSHVYIPWNKLVMEPPDLATPLHKCSCYFNLCSCNIKSGSGVATFVFSRTTRRCYKILTNIVIIISATICGLVLGCHAFWHIWILTPIRKVLLEHLLTMQWQ